MRRVALAALLSVVVAAAALTAAGAGDEGGGSYRVDAIFDNASFLIPGQDVKIAGTKVGKVKDVSLTADHKARIEMEVDRRFAPFRSDADCTIQPQSLIGEKFIQCTPGTVRGEQLVVRGDAVPTVPLANTHSPVDLDLVFATFRRPTNERVALIVNALGGGLAGRGEDLNAIIRRANPALQETRRVLRVVQRDRARIRSLLGASKQAVGALADRKRDVRTTIREGASVATATAQRAPQLSAAVDGLPELLRQARPALRDLRRLADAGTPVLADLRASVPQIRRLSGNAAPLTAAARPALTRLGSASAVGRRALRSAAPVVRRLRAFAAAAKPTGRLLNVLLQSLQRRGVPEGLQTFTYYGALASSRFDAYSHILPAHLLMSDCAPYATTPVEGCSAHFTEVPARAARRAERGGPREGSPAPVAPPAASAPERGVPAPAAKPERPRVPLVDDLLDDLPDAPGRLDDDAREALDELLDAIGGPGPKGKGGLRTADGTDVGSILDYLLR